MRRFLISLQRKYDINWNIVLSSLSLLLILVLYIHFYHYVIKDVNGSTLSVSSDRDEHNQKEVINPSLIPDKPTITPQPLPTTIQIINVYVSNTAPTYNEILNNITTSTTDSPTPTPTIQPTSNPTATPIPVATFTPTPTPIPLVSVLTGKYFNNSTLTGTPVLTRTDSDIKFDWGKNSPDSSVTADTFSASWDGTINATAGTYQLTTKHDDGMRAYIDGTLVYNQWVSQSAVWRSTTLSLTAGTHSLKVEYYEGTGDANAYFDLRKL